MSTLLVTGQPGAGKSLYVVSQFLRRYVDQGRPLFVAGLEGLKLPFQPFPPVDEWTERRPIPDMPDTTAPFFCFPEDSVLVFDECQSIFPTRSTNSRPPEIVEAFATHRKTGIDIILITQRPKQMDTMLRGLVNEHRHLRRIWGMSRSVVYTWDQCSESMTNYREATRQVWAFDKTAYPLYTSSSKHTKPISRPPILAYALPVLAIAAVGVGYVGYNRIKQKQVDIHQVNPALSSAVSPGGFNAPSQLSPAEMWAPTALMPADVTRPESAAMYAGLVQPVTAPVVAACVASATRCRCYTQQATRLDTPDDFCRDFAAVGRFDPYRQPTPQVAPQTPPAPPPVTQPITPETAQTPV